MKSCRNYPLRYLPPSLTTLYYALYYFDVLSESIDSLFPAERNVLPHEKGILTKSFGHQMPSQQQTMKPSGQLLIRARSTFCVAVLLYLCLSKATASESWDPRTFPNPQTDPARCGRSHVAKSWVCDPDKILTKKSADVIEGILKDIADAHDPYVPAKNCGGGQRVNEGYQVGILTS